MYSGGTRKRNWVLFWRESRVGAKQSLGKDLRRYAATPICQALYSAGMW